MVEITTATRRQVTAFLKPAVDAGLIPGDQYRAILGALKATGKAERTEPEAPHLLTAAEAAKRLSVCAKTVHRYAKKGLLTPVYMEKNNPKSLRYKSAEVGALVEGGGK